MLVLVAVLVVARQQQEWSLYWLLGVTPAFSLFLSIHHLFTQLGKREMERERSRKKGRRKKRTCGCVLKNDWRTAQGSSNFRRVEDLLRCFLSSLYCMYCHMGDMWCTTYQPIYFFPFTFSPPNFPFSGGTLYRPIFQLLLLSEMFKRMGREKEGEKALCHPPPPVPSPFSLLCTLMQVYILLSRLCPFFIVSYMHIYYSKVTYYVTL